MTELKMIDPLRRRFITPEGVDLKLELGSAGTRAGAFLLDALMVVGTLIAMTIGILFLLRSGATEILAIIWLIGFFVLRFGWFVMFEMGGRGATPGKRVMGLRVVARDGARLTGGAVIARNAMREIEVFLPLSFLGYQTAQGAADAFLAIFALLWSGIFLFFPLMNRDRLRIGDMLAGTWVVRVARQELGHDLVAHGSARPRRTFSAAALNLYGVYELQTLEDVLRRGRDDAVTTVAETIRRKAGLPRDGDDYSFLSDYYAALCVHLERGLMVGRRRDSKSDTLASGAGRPRRVFSAAALNMYGAHQLQTLEGVLRRGNEEQVTTIADTIRRKAGLPRDGDDVAFLSDYYAALRAHLERGELAGR
ncbi:RDD family protein [Sphingomonas alpina]|uniref:RDD family protein n=1 Tax=Sphingomonas alpina TaxID=653931 RepID=UPI0028ED4127|nr:RDD family protein [Sphingomonas alpina]